jgi:hypothetical protein
MTILSLVDTSSNHGTSSATRSEPWQRIYQDLLTEPRDGKQLARDFLETCLQDAAAQPCDLPDSPSELHAWSFRGVKKVTQDYAAYLARRRAGGGRQYFTHRAHALCFLRSVAPTKLVDGAWLYGTLPHWRDVRLQPLVRTYLEELGDGVPGQNHALMYRRLLAAEGCDELSHLDDSLYLQGAIQLALGHMADDYLPEVIGYNLGYEQLPLHLLISAFELEELDIDPYYFLLHVTIDNSATGHAAKAVRAVLDNLPRVGDAKNFYRRVALGYRLNDLGESSHTIISGFDLEQELFSMFEHKRAIAGQVHSDYCRIEGRTVNQWLSADEGISGFLDALQSRGWIKRHQDPINSRFWSLVQGEGAEMFGVFNAYEQQLIHDWIAGDWLRTPAAAQPSTRPFQKNRQRIGILPPPQSELHSEQQLLQEQLQRLDPVQREARLIELLAPVYHPTSAGLTATRIFSALAH